MEKTIQIKNINFKKFKIIKKQCLWLDRDKEAIILQKNLYSVGDIVQDGQYSNLFFEICYTKWGGCMCWLWNDIGTFTFRVGYVCSSYSLDKFFSMIKNYPLTLESGEISKWLKTV